MCVCALLLPQRFVSVAKPPVRNADTFADQHNDHLMKILLYIVKRGHPTIIVVSKLWYGITTVFNLYAVLSMASAYLPEPPSVWVECGEISMCILVCIGFSGEGTNTSLLAIHIIIDVLYSSTAAGGFWLLRSLRVIIPSPLYLPCHVDYVDYDDSTRSIREFTDARLCKTKILFMQVLLGCSQSL